jgi:hypothetical protein
MTPQKNRNHILPVPQLFDLTDNTKGEVGIEIETIGKSLPPLMVAANLWTVKQDGSIKVRSGELGYEYVLAQPVGRPKVEVALDQLLLEFKNAGSIVAEDRVSNSVHVHINAKMLTMKQVYTWLTLYFIFEELLVRWAGPDRVGNLFCLRAKDAQGLVKSLATAAKNDSFYGGATCFTNKNYRYAAVNCMALSKFGSLEFRAMRGTAKKDVLMLWVNTLLAIKDKSLEYTDPVHVLSDFSRRTCMGMCNHVMPPEMKQYMFQQPDFLDSLYEGARLAQDFAFSTEWQKEKLNITTSASMEPPRKKKTVAPGFTYTSNLNSFDEFPVSSESHWATTLNTATEAISPAAPPSYIQGIWTGVLTPDGQRFKQAQGLEEVHNQSSKQLKPSKVQEWQLGGYNVKWQILPGTNHICLALVVNQTGSRVRWIKKSDFLV